MHHKWFNSSKFFGALSTHKSNTIVFLAFEFFGLRSAVVLQIILIKFLLWVDVLTWTCLNSFNCLLHVLCQKSYATTIIWTTYTLHGIHVNNFFKLNHQFFHFQLIIFNLNYFLQHLNRVILVIILINFLVYLLIILLRNSILINWLCLLDTLTKYFFEVSIIDFLMIANMLRTTLCAKHSFILIFFSTIKTVCVDPSQIYQKYIKSLLSSHRGIL